MTKPNTETISGTDLQTAFDKFNTNSTAIDSVYFGSPRNIDTIADLKALTGTELTGTVVVIGTDSGVRGIYHFDGASTKTNDDQWIIQPTTGTGRWLRFTPKEQTLSINSIVDLKALPADLFEAGIQVNVAYYSTEGDGGGGTFRWDSASTDTDNGGTIIQGTGITNGRWERLFSGAVNVRWFGAQGDDTTNDTTNIQGALDAAVILGKDLFFPQGTYLLNTDISNSSNTDIRVYGEKGSIIKTNGTNGLALSSPQTSYILASNVNRGDRTISLTDATGISDGDIILLRSTESAETGWSYPHRALFKVTGVSGNTVTVSGRIQLNFHTTDTGVGVAVCKSPRKVSVSNIEFLITDSRGIALNGIDSLLIEACVAIDASGNKVSDPFFLENCFGSRVRDLVLEGCRYGVVVQNCAQFSANGIRANQLRHAFTITYFSNGVYIDDLHGENNDGIMDAHPSFDVHYSRVVTNSDTGTSNIRSAGGSLRNSVLRSVGIAPPVYFQSIAWKSGSPHDYSSIYDETSFTVEDLEWDCDSRFSVANGGNVSIRNSYFHNAGTLSGMIVSGGSPNSVQNLRIDNCRFDVSASKVRCKYNRPEYSKLPWLGSVEEISDHDGALVGYVITPTASGSGYSDTTDVTVTGGSGSGATVDIRTTAGAIDEIDISSMGSGYTEGDVLTVSGGNADATLTVSSNNLVRASFDVRAAPFGIADGFQRYWGLLKSPFNSSGTWPSVVFGLRIRYPNNSLDNGGASGYFFTKIGLIAALRHSNSGNSDIKEVHFHLRPGQSGQSIWTTPAYTDNNTGQTNESLSITALRSDQTAGAGDSTYVDCFFLLASGRTNPVYSTSFEITQLFQSV